MGTQVCQKGQLEDVELDPEVQRRRNALFEQYVYPYRNMIYKLCIRYSWDSRNVEENYTEVLANFYRRIETYNPNLSIRTWLHIVTKRHVIAIEKKRNSHNMEDELDEFADYGEDMMEDDEPSSNVLGADNYRQYYNDDILSLLDEMKPIHRDALILQESGYSLKEIVDIEYKKGSLKSRNIETVKSRLFLARQYLKKHLTRDGERILDKTIIESYTEDSF